MTPERITDSPLSIALVLFCLALFPFALVELLVLLRTWWRALWRR
jgi:hypothetical protein